MKKSLEKIAQKERLGSNQTNQEILKHQTDMQKDNRTRAWSNEPIITHHLPIEYGSTEAELRKNCRTVPIPKGTSPSQTRNINSKRQNQGQIYMNSSSYYPTEPCRNKAITKPKVLGPKNLKIHQGKMSRKTTSSYTLTFMNIAK